jgi:hypothetical protein
MVENNKIFGGIKGFKLRKENDNIKNEFCVKNNINLIRIKYTNDIKEEIKKVINV